MVGRIDIPQHLYIYPQVTKTYRIKFSLETDVEKSDPSVSMIGVSKNEKVVARMSSLKLFRQKRSSWSKQSEHHIRVLFLRIRAEMYTAFQEDSVGWRNPIEHRKIQISTRILMQT